MNKRGITILLTFGLVFLLPLASIGGGSRVLSIGALGKVHKVKEPITIRLTNTGKFPMKFCIEGGASIDGQPAPRPDFEVQRWVEGKWNNQLIGPDVGSFLIPEILGAGESKDFLLALFGPGRYRFRLSYVVGDVGVKCPDLGPESKRAKSPVITVTE